ncbi:hypothetical protein NDU88_001443 [Pleurodeles waltl]|uniref:Uncharacterized protein n=1 Tax=Pleurodeles waltl TaxID=8319 RepID=A0AAV7LXP0_PLEWA|nr:hypothetical protein NDU88_001443 [Pleurodeles waltl]
MSAAVLHGSSTGGGSDLAARGLRTSAVPACTCRPRAGLRESTLAFSAEEKCYINVNEAGRLRSHPSPSQFLEGPPSPLLRFAIRLWACCDDFHYSIAVTMVSIILLLLYSVSL